MQSIVGSNLSGAFLVENPYFWGKIGMRYCIEFSYFGKHYFGYQIQPRQNSIQEEMEKALSTLLREEIKIVGAGRTDTGVHAKKIFAHFDSLQNIELENLCHRLNNFLPPDIAIHRIFRVSDSFHARFEATYRTYEYRICMSKNPFTADFAWMHWKRDLNISKMNEAAKILLEYEDFASFSKIGADNKTTFCTIFFAEWKQENNELIFTISANRFLRNMVRAIVGTLVEIGLEKINIEDFRKIIEAKDRGKAGSSAPAQGLYLVDVGYYWERFNII